MINIVFINLLLLFSLERLVDRLPAVVTGRVGIDLRALERSVPQELLDDPDIGMFHHPGCVRVPERPGGVRLSQGAQGDLVADSFQVSVLKSALRLGGPEQRITRRDSGRSGRGGGVMLREQLPQFFRDIDQAGVVDGFVACLHLDGGIELAAEKDILPGQITNFMASKPAVKQQTESGGVSCRRILERELQDGNIFIRDNLNSHKTSY